MLFPYLKTFLSIINFPFFLSTLILSLSTANEDSGDQAPLSSSPQKTLSSSAQGEKDPLVTGRLWGIREQEIDYLFKSCTDLVCIIDDKGYFQRINTQGAGILGWQMAELLEKSFLDLVHPKHMIKMREYLQGKHPSVMVNKVLRKDGGYCWLDWIALPDLSEPTSPGHPILFARDITLQKVHEKKTRKALKISAQGLKNNNQILNTVIRIQASWTREIFGGPLEEGKSLQSVLKNLLRLSQSEFAFLGYFKNTAISAELINPMFCLSPQASPEIGKFFSKLGKEDQTSLHPFKGICERILQTNQQFIQTKTTALNKLGVPSLKTFIGLPLWCEEKTIGVMGLVNAPGVYCSSAVTELQPLTRLASRIAHERRLYKEAESQRRAHIQALKTASEAKTTFISHISHEIRNPLNGIIGLLDLMGEDPLNPENPEYIKGAQSASSTLISLLNDTLDIAKIEAGQFKLENIEFNPFRVAQEVVQPFLLQAKKKGVALNLMVASEIPDHLVGDPTRLRQIFSNLLSNALKFTENGAINVTLKPGQRDPTYSGTNKNDFILCGSVQDTGIGISFEAQQRLFRPFSQADTSTNRRFGGTGLGLSIVKNLCELMGGTIYIKSQPHKGSTFKFQIILCHPERLFSPPLPSREDINLQDIRVLLAEDNLVNQTVIKAILGRRGCLVAVVDSGLKAVEAIKKAAFELKMPYDLVLMDGHMPDMDGKEATIYIRRLFSKKQLPIIAVTASAVREEEEEFFEAGINAYVTKPLQAKALIAAITKCLTLP
ncbi:MAG: response regulator [Candidatus Paracaedibacteraceae bacterium]|nr:response regulator [Candidatus Paracaedibacteraceae bacterium]